MTTAGGARSPLPYQGRPSARPAQSLACLSWREQGVSGTVHRVFQAGHNLKVIPPALLRALLPLASLELQEPQLFQGSSSTNRGSGPRSDRGSKAATSLTLLTQACSRMTPLM